MKKQILALLLVILIVASCENKKKRDFTILGMGTQYSGTPEILNGKVKYVIEKNYWAEPDGDSYKKGKPVTMADRDSLLKDWTNDFEAMYDENGVLLSCTGLDESGNQLWKNENVKVSDSIARVNIYRKDTLAYFDTIRYEGGFPVKGFRYKAEADTLWGTADIKTNNAGLPTEFLMFGPKGDSAGKIISAYNEQNNLLNTRFFNKDGQLRTVFEVKYNDKNKISELIIRDKDNNIVETNIMTYEYDDKENWTKAIIKDVKGTENRFLIAERSYRYFE